MGVHSKPSRVRLPQAAGAAVQNAVVAIALTRDGQSKWSPSDGC